MASIFVPEPPLLPLSASSASAPADRLQCLPLQSRPGRRLFPISVAASGLRRSFNVAAGATFMPSSVPEKNGVFTVGDFMTRREDLHVVKPTTTVDEAIELLVENRITGFPVIDDDWKLVGLVSDYDLLALDTISAYLEPCQNKEFSASVQFHLSSHYYLVAEELTTACFQKLTALGKLLTRYRNCSVKPMVWVVGDVRTPAPVVVSETTNLGDVARLLLEAKYRRLAVVNESGKLIGIITRGNVIRAALQMKRASESKT